MINLTEVSIGTRKFIFFLAIALIIYLILKVSFGVARQYWIISHPTPLTPPDARFGEIPSLKFAKFATSSSGLTFSLQNIEGRPPETTNSARVFLMPKKLPSLLAIERVKELAIKLGFTKEPELVNQTDYSFIDQTNPLRTLNIDSVNLNFLLKYDYSRNPKIFDNITLRSKDQSTNEVNKFVKSNNLFDESIINGKTTTDLLIYNADSKKLLPATSLSQTQVMRVNFFREDIDNLKVLSPSNNQSYNYIFFAPSSFVPNQILEISYTFWPIAKDNFATYPLRSSTTAWQDLIDGYAVVVSLGNNLSKTITIRNISLAYYDSEEPQQYLQPVFVFEGDNDFVAYLPAISSEWLE